MVWSFNMEMLGPYILSNQFITYKISRHVLNKLHLIKL